MTVVNITFIKTIFKQKLPILFTNTCTKIQDGNYANDIIYHKTRHFTAKKILSNLSGNCIIIFMSEEMVVVYFIWIHCTGNGSHIFFSSGTITLTLDK